MGGALWVFTGENDASILYDNTQINLNVLEACRKQKVGKVFFSSSACVYPDIGKIDSGLQEFEADPTNCDSDYGREKWYAEILYQAYARNHGMNVRIARLHNVFGSLGTWRGGREKAPAAICRKVAEATTRVLVPPDGGDCPYEIEIFGDGRQQRSFLYIDECVEGIVRLMASDFQGPVNLGSEHMVTIDELVGIVSQIAGKPVTICHIPGPIGVRGRNSDNTLIREKLGWAPSGSLRDGLVPTYAWISEQVEKFR